MLKKYSVLILILFLAVGYAGISTKHIIDASINIGYDEKKFRIEFSETNTYYGISSVNKNSIDFKTKELKNINDEAILDFSIVNKSQEYDSSISVNCQAKDTSASLTEYFDISSDIVSPLNLKAGKEENMKVVIKMKKNYSGTSGITPEITCSISTTPIPRSTLGEKYIPKYKDTTLNGCDPEFDVDKKLIPIRLANNGTATYADVKEEWYNYENKEWANAVILVDSPSKIYNTGDVIKESDIESYFVWIPRFRYLIFDDGNYSTYLTSSRPTTSNAKEIQIEFETKDTTKSTGITKGEWLTHPAFTNYNTNGIWVGKFETGYLGATSTTSAEKNINDASKVIVKPNVYSWRSITVSNAFKTALNYEKHLVSHMMRNMEWGAVAYLSHSKYGINNEVRKNNNSSFKTGYAATDSSLIIVGTDSSKTQGYNTTTGYKASTTGNITGVYDMSGGAWEYVAAYRENTIGASGFSSEELAQDEIKRHLELYTSDISQFEYNKRILGDATGEMGPFYKSDVWYVNNWYNENSRMVESSNPWFIRGGYHSHENYTGQFVFHGYTGDAKNNFGFRITLAPN